MQKRLVSFLLTLMLLCTVAPVAAQEAAGSALYRIAVMAEDGSFAILGTGVLYQESNILLTSQGCCMADTALYAISLDGQEVIAVSSIGQFPDSDLALLQLSEAAVAAPLTLSATGLPERPVVNSYDANGLLVPYAVTQVRKGLHGDDPAYLLTTDAGLLPGGVLLGADGGIAGVILSAQAEGEGHYIAVHGDTIARLTGAEPVSVETPEGIAWLDANLTYAEGFLTIDWSGDARESGTCYIMLIREGNLFYNTYVADAGSTSIELPVSPGSNLYVLVQCAEEAPSFAYSLPADKAFPITVPEATFEGYDFQESSYLISTPSGADPTDYQDTPVATVATEDLLSGSVDFYYQINNTYAVSEMIETSLIVELVAPDGQCYAEPAMYIFDPSLQASDRFAMELAALFESCAAYSEDEIMQPGMYTLRYAIGGGWAGECTFTVE